MAALPWVGIGAVVGTWSVGVGGASPAETTSHRRAHLAPTMLAPITRAAAPIPVRWVLLPVGGNGLNVYANPDPAAASQNLPPADELGSPLVLLATARQGDWFLALLPSRPNGSTGWVRASDVTVSAPAYRVEVSRAAHQLKLVRLADGAVVMTSEVGVGSAATPQSSR